MHFRSQKKRSQDISLSEYIETGADGAPLELMDVVSDQEDLLETISGRQQRWQLIRAVNSVLTDQEKQVIVLRYGLQTGKPCRQREVADVTGISRSYVSRVEKKALHKLRMALEGEG